MKASLAGTGVPLHIFHYLCRRSARIGVSSRKTGIYSAQGERFIAEKKTFEFHAINLRFTIKQIFADKSD